MPGVPVGVAEFDAGAVAVEYVTVEPMAPGGVLVIPITVPLTADESTSLRENGSEDRPETDAIHWSRIVPVELSLTVIV